MYRESSSCVNHVIMLTVNRVGQVWEFTPGYIALVMESRIGEWGWVHQIVYLVADDRPFSTLLFPCLEELFVNDGSCETKNIKRLV